MAVIAETEIKPYAGDDVLRGERQWAMLQGDVLTRLAQLPADSVDLVLTSPPFLALRSYLPTDHPDKALEGGSQATPGEYLDWLLDVVEACDRVIAPHGSLVFELGDTYADSGGGGGDYLPGGLREGQPGFAGSVATARESNAAHWRQKQAWKKHEGNAAIDAAAGGGGRPRPAGHGWPLAKSLSVIPQLFAVSLAYGFNPLTGRTTDRWRVRNVVAWCRPNPPVGALADKFRPATSYLTVACKSAKRWFDLDAVRTPHATDPTRAGGPKMVAGIPAVAAPNALANPAGAPPLDWWLIPTQPLKEAHYAAWPMKLLERPIKSMCPERVCRECGEPSRRIAEASYEPTQATNNPTARGAIAGVNGSGGDPTFVHGRANKIVETIGWTACGHDDWRPGVVLDPFAGSGTTGIAALRYNRAFLGIELSETYAAMARRRIYGDAPMFNGLEAGS